MTTNLLQELLAELASHDVKLWAEDGKLRVNAPQGALTPDLKARLSAAKEDLLVYLERKDQEVPDDFSIRPYPRDQVIPLTQGQERIWSLARMVPDSSVYNVPSVFALTGRINRQALEQALNGMQARYEILRTVFPGDTLASVHQQILPHTSLVLSVTDLSRDFGKLEPKQTQRAIDQILQKEVRRPFDLKLGPLWRARLFRLRPGQHLLVMTMHHIIFDGISKSIFLAELGERYSACAAGTDFPEPPAAVQFADFAAWQKERLDPVTIDRQLAYWTERLGGQVAAVATPNQRPRQPGKGSAGSIHFNLPDTLSAQLSAFARSEQVSLFILFMAAFDVLLNRFTGQEDLLVCAPMASRDHADIEKLIGYFNNIVVIRTDLSANPSFRELLAQLRKLAVEAYDNQFIALQRLAQMPQLVRTPLARTMLSFQDSSSQHLQLKDIEAHAINVRKGEADFDLALYVERDGDSIGGVLDFNADIFSADLIQRFLQRYGYLLDLLVKNPDQPISALPRFGKPLEKVKELFDSHPQIDSSVLVVDPRTGELNAYLVLNEHDVPSLDSIREFAAASLPAYRVPAAFIPVDELPLLADGAVDIAALPAPATDRSRLATPYQAPQSPLEEQLAAIWKTVLWLDHDVGRNDRFRELGGHSLLSVQLIVEIEKELGREVPARALAQLDTVAGLAQLLEAGDDEDVSASPQGLRLPADIYHGLRSHTASWEGVRASEDSVTVGLNVEGSKPALFWCLQRYQELTQLARYLGAEQPVYGMRSGNRVMIKTQDNIDLLAGYYVDEILAIQPQGPYRIGGNCQAAQIAFQIATQLQARGHVIDLLILHEKFIPFAYSGRVALTFGEDSTYNPKRHFRNPQFGWRKYYSGPMTSREVKGAHGQFFKEPNVQDLTGAIQGYLSDVDTDRFDALYTAQESIGQVLPDEAYRTRLTTPASFTAAPGSTRRLSVEVLNTSTVCWLSADRSGILLANRWLNADGQVQREMDGFTPLPDNLEAGASVVLDLDVTVPESAGQWKLEIDLIDEGVARFSERGASPCVVSVQVI
ncbi:MAG: condensation domain-containing protein [Gammaproteobacteria bacterium]|nr:condensation domain-containing protein [Gammaproteobacteria bacterium]MDP2139740.1 condensation domain-containing protein [Gammaproteobacteria bacterium]MDP2348943.1 condensation domain-containing protein [Gammaproteobacteria bacterium]